MTGVVGITFALYSEPTGGAALWLETQNVTADNNGHYTALLGSTKPEGLPAELFTSEQARWVGVQVSGQPEQPRVLLVSAPYALKAGDAETVGGLPPSAFVLAAPSSSGSAATNAPGATAGSVSPATATDVTTTGGVAKYLPVFNAAATVIDSAVYQSGAGTTAKIGIGTTSPATTLDVKGTGTIRGALSLPAISAATATKGSNSQPLDLVASGYSTTAAVNQTFQWQAEPVGNDTTTPSGTLNLLFGSGTIKPAETGLHIASNGQITFAAGQTFPGTGGGITGVTAGTDLTGGGSSGNVTLSLNTSATDLRYGQLGAANTFTGNQTVDGILQVSSTAFGVAASVTAPSGFSLGVGGTAASPNGYGVQGVNTGAGGAGVYGLDSAGIGVSAYGVTGVSAGGTSYGVNANATAAGSTGVYGTAPQFGLYGLATGSGNTVGVFGSGADGLQGSGTVHGVYAASTGAGSSGVYATAPAFGLYGVATATSGNSVGVYGTGIDGLQGSGSAYGVYGAASASGSTGVYGTAPQFGVYGVATAGSGNTVGVFGRGVDGLQGAGTIHGVYANGSQYGVESFTSAGVAGTYGVYQDASTTGATFFSESGKGGAVWADTNWNGESLTADIPALLATADANYGAILANNSSDIATAWIVNLANGPTTTVVRAGGTGGSCSLTGGGDAACTGTLKSVVATTGSAGARRVETYSMQSPENWFEDFGSGALSNGAATITLDPTFTQTVNTGTEYHVFLTPNGDSKGLYVSQKTATSFEVREQGGGTSSIAFDYRIVAKRVGYENVRLADVTERFNQQEERSKNMRRPSQTRAEAKSGPKMPTPPSVAMQSATQMPTPPALPPAALRPEPITSRPIPLPPARVAVKPLAAQPK